MATDAVVEHGVPGDRTASPVLAVDEVTVRFGGIVALDGLSFAIAPQEICGLIGPNGAGKTTMFNCVSRLYQPTAGRIAFQGKDLLSMPVHGIARAGIARTFQNLGLFPALTVIENVMVGAHTTSRANFVTAPFRLPGVRREEKRLETKAYGILQELDLAEFAYRPAAGLPFGTLKRLELARALASDPTLLMLDEPANGLNHNEVMGLAEVVRDIRDRRQLTVLLVEHHMAMVMAISDHIVVMDFGRKIAEGTADQVREDPRVIEAYLGEAPNEGDR